MRYVTIAEIKALDRAAIDERGIPAATLMERAGKAVTDEAMAMVKGGPIIVICGYGNNGGDGFVAARHLIRAGYQVRVLVVGTPREYSPETRANFESLLELGCEPDTVMLSEDIEKAADAVSEGILIIDAIFGVGVRGPLKELYVRLIDTINTAARPVIAVDVPSGLDADTGEPLPVAVKAVKTVTMGYPKAGFEKPSAKEYIGDCIVAEIGI